MASLGSRSETVRTRFAGSALHVIDGFPSASSHQKLMEENARREKQPMTLLKRTSSGFIDLVGGVLGRKRTTSGGGIKISDLDKYLDLDEDEGIRRRETRRSSDISNATRLPRVVKAS